MCVIYIGIYPPAPVCRSRRTGVQCFYTDSGRPAPPAFPAAAAPRPAGSTEVCHTPAVDCGCTGARATRGMPFRTAGGGPALRCPWPAGSGPGRTKDLRRRSCMLVLAMCYLNADFNMLKILWFVFFNDFTGHVWWCRRSLGIGLWRILQAIWVSRLT